MARVGEIPSCCPSGHRVVLVRDLEVGVFDGKFRSIQNLVMNEFETSWSKKFIRPAETRWMVIWEGAVLLDERCGKR